MEGRRKFNGEVYELRAERKYKKDAMRLKDVIKDARRKGNVRVTHEHGMYQVWVR